MTFHGHGRVFVGLCAVVAVVSACGGGGGSSGGGGGGSSFSAPDEGVQADSLDYGLIYDKTGPTAVTQVPFASGIKAYFDKVNSNGGVHGRKINVLECDGKYEVAPAMACLRKFIDQTPVVGMTALNSGSFQAAGTSVAVKNEVPVIGPESTTKKIVHPFPGWVWGLECSYPAQADVAVAFAMKKLGKTSIRAVGVGGNVASASEYLGQIKERVEKAGGTYVKTVKYQYGTPNMDQQAQEIARIDPDVIFTHGGSGQAVPLHNSLQKFGVTNDLVIGIFPEQDPSVAKASKAIGQHYYTMNCYSNAGQTDVPGVSQMIADAKAAGYDKKTYVTTEFANGYVVGMVAVEAMKRAGAKLTRASLNNAVQSIHEFDTNGLSPTVSFGKNDSVGIEVVRPYRYDYGSDEWVSVGDYADYADCISNEYRKGNIKAWQPDCISKG